MSKVWLDTHGEEVYWIPIPKKFADRQIDHGEFRNVLLHISSRDWDNGARTYDLHWYPVPFDYNWKDLDHEEKESLMVYFEQMQPQNFKTLQEVAIIIEQASKRVNHLLAQLQTHKKSR